MHCMALLRVPARMSQTRSKVPSAVCAVGSLGQGLCLRGKGLSAPRHAGTTEVPASRGAVTSRGIFRKPEGSPAACCHETEPKWKPRVPSPSRTLGPAAFASHPVIFYHCNQRKTKPSFFFFFLTCLLNLATDLKARGTRPSTMLIYNRASKLQVYALV